MNIVEEKTTSYKKTGERLTSSDPDEELASIVKRLGNPVSTILLQSPCSIFRIPQVDGIIGYQLITNCAVVIGDPVCLPEHVAELTLAFQLFCQKSQLTIVYFLTSDSFANWAISNGCSTLIQVGEELIIDPTKFRKRQKLQWKVNQSAIQGVVIHEYQNFDPTLEDQMNSTIETWLKAKEGPQIHLGEVHFNFVNKRIFYALQNEKIVGLLILTPVDHFQGWVVSSFLAIAEAPVGTTEHLMCSVFDTLAKEDCHFLCLGAIAGSRLGKMVGLGRLAQIATTYIFKISKWFFHLDAKRNYLNKYHPHSWPTYILFSKKLSFSALLSIKQLLNVKL